MSERNYSIIKKIKGLLALANNNSNDEEAQTAFIMAQKLMLKNNITMGEVEDIKTSQEIEEGQVTVNKKLFWWERELSIIISKNFRVKNFINSKLLKNNFQRKRAIIFLGYENDVALAKEMYLLAYEVIAFYSKRFVENYCDTNDLSRTKKITTEVKNSYIRGFLEGLNNKFEQQVSEMKQENALMVLVPHEVEAKYNEMFEGKKGLSFKMPPIEELEAYRQGYTDGNRIDYTKSTIDDEILTY